jgi:hypothetical protein
MEKEPYETPEIREEAAPGGQAQLLDGNGSGFDEEE